MAHRTCHSILAITLFVCNARAQQPFPTFTDSAQWSVVLSVMGMSYGTQVLRFADTLSMCGHQYSVSEEPIFGSSGYFRNEGSRTYVRRTTECSDREYLVYDFGLGVDDTTYVGMNTDWGDQDTSIAIVSEVVSIPYQGIVRRQFTILVDRCPTSGSEPFLTPMYWLEGIGSLTHPFYPLLCICDGCETGMSLSCFDSTGVALYRAGPNVTCHQNVSVDEASPAPAFIIGQHMLNGSLAVKFPEEFRTGHLFIFDLAGRNRLSQQVIPATRSVQTGVLEAGVFIAILIDEEGRRWSARWLSVPQN